MSNSREVIFDIIASLERRMKYLEKRDDDLDRLEEKFRILEEKFREQQESQIELQDDRGNHQVDPEQNEVGQNIVISEVFSNFEAMDQQSTFSNRISDVEIRKETLENLDNTVRAVKIDDQVSPVVQLPSKSRSGRLIKKRKLSDSEDPSSELFDCHICLKSFSTFRGLENHSQNHNLNLVNKIDKKGKTDEIQKLNLQVNKIDKKDKIDEIQKLNLVNKMIKKVKTDEIQPKASPPKPIRIIQKKIIKFHDASGPKIHENNDNLVESYQNLTKIDKNPTIVMKGQAVSVVQSGGYKCPYPHCMKKYQNNDSLKIHIRNNHYSKGEMLPYNAYLVSNVHLVSK